MNQFEILILSSLSLLCSYLTTWVYRWLAVKRRILDIPNHRSAHQSPVPSGGGLAIAMSTLLVSLWLHFVERLSFGSLVVYLPAFLLMLLGFVDDRLTLSVRFRLLMQVVIAAILLMLLVPAYSDYALWVKYFLLALTLLYLLWTVNLYNFMDGIDGIASIQALSVLGGALLIYWLQSPSLPGDMLLHVWVLAAVLGFLIWNWYPAKIFMGDTGSLFLGMWIGSAALITSLSGQLSIYVWLILMAVFYVDASFTLLMRLLAGETIYQAHSRHAYQQAARAWGHARVSMGLLLINLCWLLPMALLAQRVSGRQGGLFALLVMLAACVPLLALELWINYRLPSQSLGEECAQSPAG